MPLRVVDPVGIPHSVQHALAPRIASLDGVTLGFLVNEKGEATATNFELDSHIMEDRLRSDYVLKGVVRVIKPSAFKPGSLPMIDSLAEQVDAVINGLAK
jgi:hypothetical protein